MEIRIRLPRLGTADVSNLLGLAGLVSLVVAIGSLTDWRWALLATSVILLGLSWVAQASVEARPAAEPATSQQVAERRPRAVG
jgi:hypothetical protein